jgi:hypothetical protein
MSSALHPRAVIAGQKRADRDDDPRMLEETRQSLRDVDQMMHISRDGTGTL